MVRITDKLLMSRAEHNDGALDTLEEISLHQQKLEKIEYINRVCANLKILHFQDNCIEKLENLGRSVFDDDRCERGLICGPRFPIRRACHSAALAAQGLKLTNPSHYGINSIDNYC